MLALYCFLLYEFWNSSGFVSRSLPFVQVGPADVNLHIKRCIHSPWHQGERTHLWSKFSISLLLFQVVIVSAGWCQNLLSEVKSHLFELPLLQIQRAFCANHFQLKERHRICLLFLASAECRNNCCCVVISTLLKGVARRLMVVRWWRGGYEAQSNLLRLQLNSVKGKVEEV